MLITVPDLEHEPLVFDLTFAPGTIDYGEELEQTSPLAVAGRAELLEERHEDRTVVEDIRVVGSYSGEFQTACARCLTPVHLPLTRKFDLIFRPLRADGDAESGPAEHAISTAETEIGYYQKSGLLLEDVLREQALLALPPRALCREDCKGLCPRCGRDLNTEPCVCDPAPPDPRWSALSDLAGRLKI